LEGTKLVLVHGFKQGLDRLCPFLELGAKYPLLDINLELLDDAWLGQLLSDNELLLGAVCMNGQIVSAPIGAADALDPPVRIEDLGIPAITCVDLCKEERWVKKKKPRSGTRHKYKTLKANRHSGPFR